MINIRDDSEIQINELVKKFNKKIADMSIGRKIMLIILMMIVGVSLFFLLTADVVQVFTYTQYGVEVCNETYINGIIQTDPCPQNTNYYPGDPIWQKYMIDYENMEFPLIVN